MEFIVQHIILQTNAVSRKHYKIELLHTHTLYYLTVPHMNTIVLIKNGGNLSPSTYIPEENDTTSKNDITMQYSDTSIKYIDITARYYDIRQPIAGRIFIILDS